MMKLIAEKIQFHTRVNPIKGKYIITIDYYDREGKLLLSHPIAKQLIFDMLIDCAELESRGVTEQEHNIDYSERWRTPSPNTVLEDNL